MNIFVVGTIVVLAVVTCLTDITKGDGCTVSGVFLNECEKTDWSVWDCSGCKSNHLALRKRNVCCKKGDTANQCFSRCNIHGGAEQSESCNFHCISTTTTITTASTGVTTTPTTVTTTPTTVTTTPTTVTTTPTTITTTTISVATPLSTPTSPSTAISTQATVSSAHLSSTSEITTQHISTTQPTDNIGKMQENVMFVNVCELLSASLFLLGLLLGAIIVGVISLVLHRRDAKKRRAVTPDTERKLSTINGQQPSRQYAENVREYKRFDIPGYNHAQNARIQINEYPTHRVARVELDE